MLLPKQIWKDIPEYKGLYQVNQVGQVRSLNYMKTGKVKRLKQHTDKYGYKRLELKGKLWTVHRLIALTFIPNPNNLPYVNHKDENPSNNNVNNLEWCDAKYNSNYGTRNERLSASKKGMHYNVGIDNHMYGKKGKDNPNAKRVIMLDKTTLKPIACFYSIKEAHNYLGKKANSYISECCKGKSNTAYGYKWAYLESEVL